MNPLAWLDESLSLRLVQTLLHFLWQGSAIALVAIGLEQLFRRGAAQTRYLLHVLAMLLMVICLPVTFALIHSTTDVQTSAASVRRPVGNENDAVRAQLALAAEQRLETSKAFRVDRSAAVNNVSSEVGDVLEKQTAASALLVDHSRQSTDLEVGEATSPSQAAQHHLSLLQSLAPYLTITYLSCVLAMFARLTAGIWGGYRLRAATIHVADTDLVAKIRQQAGRIGLRVIPAVAYCDRISVPVVVGILRPMILLPASIVSGLSSDQLEAVITHELAHLRRYDPLVNLLQRLVETVIFFHPAVWYISRRIDVERENASDDIVLASGWQRVRYADALVRMAELSVLLRTGKSARLPIAALAASGDSQFDFRRRILRLLDGEPAQFRLTNVGLFVFLVVMFMAVAVPLVLGTWAQQTASAAGEEKASGISEGEVIGRRIADFQLQDYRGADHALSDFAESNLVVIAFLGAECPLAKLYGPRLASLHNSYRTRGVAFLGINSNQQDSLSELGHYARQNGITFPLLKDPGNRVADVFGAERTPEVFVLDRERVIRYWGPIDDQFGVGYAKPAAQHRYLATAIDDLLAGKPVDTPRRESVGCHIGRVSRAAATGNVTYAKHISRIVQRRCLECHREGGIAPFAMDSYATVAAWAETIREVVEQQRMPPWHANPQYGHFANDGRITAAEKELLYQWIDNGVPEGSVSDLPAKREFVEGWALGKPDLVLTMPEPVTVPASGVVAYQYMTVDPGFKEGRWVRASEIRPGVRSVVHHIIVFINPPGGDPILEERGVGFETVGGYVPGSPPMELKAGVARYIPPGSTFVFQIHYTPDGIERKDQSQIGLYFADPNKIRYTMQTGVAANLDFEIPPHSDNHRVEASHRFSQDMEIYSMAPHMHFRGKSFRFEVTYPNGSREILLDIPRYDFNWQNVYRLAEPKLMPEGSLLRCVAYFDNSDDNLSNPDPSQRVRWGEQTWEEMMIGYFEGIFLNQDLSLPEPELTKVDNGNYRVRFSYRPNRPAKTVNVAGTFNEWNTWSHPLTDTDGDGVYSADIVLNEGAHRYKFVMEGNYWTHDPASRILTGFLHESFFVAGTQRNQRSESKR